MIRRFTKTLIKAAPEDGARTVVEIPAFEVGPPTTAAVGNYAYGVMLAPAEPVPGR